MADLISVSIDAGDIIEGIEELAGAIEIANISAVARIQQELRGIIIGSLELAFSEAGEGFPAIYREHLLLGVSSLQPIVTANNDGLIAEYIDIASLGDYSDLEEGFHYHALLPIENKSEFAVSNPRKLELPFTGEELLNDYEKRYDFWQALVDGTDYVVNFKGWSGALPTAGWYEETLRARVAWWGARYPEWLILEYGTDTYPTVPPTHVKYYIEQRVYEYMATIYQEIIDSVMQVWERPGIRRNSIGQLINAKGQYVKYLPDEVR